MNKKSFKDNPALAYLSNAQEATQQHTQEDTQEVKRTSQKKTPLPSPPSLTGPGADQHRQYVRTQGRKGHKKPRINLAFDSDDFLEELRARAERDGLSITQLVNKAVAHYLDSVK